jgi:transcriptional regulator with XRE-family HTH domain
MVETPFTPAQEQVQRWSARLRALMRERELTMAAVERGLGWSHGYLRQVLRPGRPALKAEQVVALAGFLGVSPGEFFGGLYGLVPAEQAEPKPEQLRRLVEAEVRAAAKVAVAAELAAAATGRLERAHALLDRIAERGGSPRVIVFDDSAGPGPAAAPRGDVRSHP